MGVVYVQKIIRWYQCFQFPPIKRGLVVHTILRRSVANFGFFSQIFDNTDTVLAAKIWKCLKKRKKIRILEYVTAFTELLQGRVGNTAIHIRRGMEKTCNLSLFSLMRLRSLLLILPCKHEDYLLAIPFSMLLHVVLLCLFCMFDVIEQMCRNQK